MIAELNLRKVFAARAVILLVVCLTIWDDGVAKTYCPELDALEQTYSEAKKSEFPEETVMELFQQAGRVPTSGLEEGQTQQFIAILSDVIACAPKDMTAFEVFRELQWLPNPIFVSALQQISDGNSRVSRIRLLVPAYYTDQRDVKRIAEELLGGCDSNTPLPIAFDTFMALSRWGVDTANYPLFGPKGELNLSSLATILLYHPAAIPKFYEECGCNYEGYLFRYIAEIVNNPASLAEKTQAINKGFDYIIATYGKGSPEARSLMHKLRSPHGDEEDYEAYSYKFPDSEYVKRWYDIILPQINEMGEYEAMQFFAAIGKVFDRMGKTAESFDYTKMSLLDVLKRQRGYLEKHYGKESAEYRNFVKHDVISRYGEYSEEYDLIMSE